MAVQSMYKNELSIVSIKPELAYGEVGRTKAPSGKTEEVPGNSRITYLFGLLHFEKAKEIKVRPYVSTGGGQGGGRPPPLKLRPDPPTKKGL